MHDEKKIQHLKIS